MTVAEAVLNEDMSWMDQANCLGLDPDLFFPEVGSIAKDAKSVCAGCVVRSQCLTHALDSGEDFGVWGGLSPRERKRLRTEQRRAAR